MKKETTAKSDVTKATTVKAAEAPVAAEVKAEVKTPVKEVAAEKTAEKGVSEEKKTEEKKVAKTEEKKATKTTEKKAAKTTKTTTKTTAKKAVKEDLKPEVFIQYQGNEAVVADAVEKAKAVYVAAGHRVSSIKSLQVYLKPEEYAAYFVINQKFAGRVDLF